MNHCFGAHMTYCHLCGLVVGVAARAQVAEGGGSDIICHLYRYLYSRRPIYTNQGSYDHLCGLVVGVAARAQVAERDGQVRNARGLRTRDITEISSFVATDARQKRKRAHSRVRIRLSSHSQKQSPDTGARVNNTLHKELGYPIREPARQSACEARP